MEKHTRSVRTDRMFYKDSKNQPYELITIVDDKYVMRNLITGEDTIYEVPTESDFENGAQEDFVEIVQYEVFDCIDNNDDEQHANLMSNLGIGYICPFCGGKLQWEYDFIVSENNPRRDYVFPNGIPAYEDIREYFLKNGDDEFRYMEWPLLEEYCRRNNVPDLCPHCGGEGTVWLNDEVKALHDNFEKVEPPEGEGYQLWETTSEGSPISPVFATLDELCEWCEENASTFGPYKATKEEWKRMLDDGFVYHEEGNMMFL